MGILVLVIAYVTYSWSVWKQPVAFAEDTGALAVGFHNIAYHRWDGDINTIAYTFVLKCLQGDAVAASGAMRFLVSGLTTIALFLVLSCFSDRIRLSAILFATFVWIASRLNSPIIQNTTRSHFAFAIALLGLFCLLRWRNLKGLCGFCFFSFATIRLRPEYVAPFAVLIFLEIARQVFRRRHGGNADGSVRNLVFLLGIMILGLFGLRMVAERTTQENHPSPNKYLLLGLGQCYASFYKQQHPGARFDAMTEYRDLLNRTFGSPKSFTDAVVNNPREMARYCVLNTFDNLRLIPEELLATRSTNKSPFYMRIHTIMLYAVIMAGLGILLQKAIGRSWLHEARLHLTKANIVGAFCSKSELLWRVGALLAFCSSASVAILLLVASPRYWLSLVPITYLGIAWCFEMIAQKFAGNFGGLSLAAVGLVAFCRPGFLGPHPVNQHVLAMKSLRPLVRTDPFVGALWADPFCIYGFNGEAKPVNIRSGTPISDISAKKCDILVIDPGLRNSQLWADERAFFEKLEAEPENYGFKEFIPDPSGKRHYYYVPRGSGER